MYTDAAGDADGLGRVTGAAGADNSGIRLKRIVHHHAGVISNLLRSQQELCALLHGRFRQLGQFLPRCAVVFIGCDVADQRNTARAGVHSEVQLRIHLVGGGGRPGAAQIFFFVNIHSPVMLPFFVNIPFTFLMASFICMACFPSPVMLRSGRTG